MKREEKNIGYIIPHTHWDREWRYPIWKNRMLLIEFMEELLQILDTDPDYHCFLLDGQVAPIEDYLEVVPGNKEKVAKYIKDGRIAVGPWYTLPDLYPLDGECLVRNLLKGIRISQKYGDYLKVGYNSFGWGQIAQFPQIYAGFGLDFIICAKKVSEERAPVSEFLWEAPDGTKVLTSRLGKHARANFYFHAYLYAKYGINCLSSEYKYSPQLSGTAMHNAAAQNRDEDFFLIGSKMEYKADFLAKGLQDAWEATDETILKTHRLFLNGTDFSTPHPELTSMIKDLNDLDENTEFINTRLEEYAKKLHELMDKDKLRVIKGELRDGPSCDCSGNALASRIYLKQLNKKVQNVLIHKAEPLASLANMLGKAYPKGFLDVAWKYVLESHPHDSINGVTQDKTADDVEHRLNQALEMGNVAYDKSVSEILKMLDLSKYDAKDTLLVVFNPHPRPVNDVVKACVCTPQEANIWSLIGIDCDGNKIDIQEVSRDEKPFPVHDLEARPWPYFADRHICYVYTGEIPAMGYKVIKFVPESHFKRDHFYWMNMRKSTGEYISHADNILENEYLRVEINTNGTLKVKDKKNDREYDSLHYFEDTGDIGNYWAYYPPYNNKTYTSLVGNAKSWYEDNGPLSATIAIEYTMELPAYGHEAMYGIRGESKRSEETEIFKIISRVTLKKGSKKVDIETTVKNNVKNHRLRIAFPTGIKAEYASASGHFTVDDRPRVPLKEKDGKYWPEMQTLPMQHFVDVSDGNKGIALLNNCLTEYELKDDENSTLYLTLFRAIGNMIVTWWEAVGVFPGKDGSQLLREMDFEYSIYPHDGNWIQGNVYSEAESLNVPLAPYQVNGNTIGSLPEKYSFLSIKPDNLVLSAFKKAEDRDSFIIRLFNPTDEEIHGTIQLGVNINEAYMTNLNEERLNDLLIENKNSIKIDVATNKIITVELVV